MSTARFDPRLVTLVRVMLGVEFVINGLNWWVKLITPYPSIGDFSAAHPPHFTVVGAMIATGFLFHIVKATELTAGILLLANRFVPLALVGVFPVTLNVFFVDVLISHHWRSFFNGTGTLVMSIFLMIAYLAAYAPMLAMRARPDPAGPAAAAAFPLMATGPARAALMALGVVAAGFGTVILCWLAVLIFQHFTG